MDSKEPKSKSQSIVKKQKQQSLLRKILTQIKDEPIRPSAYPTTPKSGPPGVLLDLDYQGDVGVAKLKIYDINKRQIYEWLDNTEHHPYCLTDLSPNELSQQNDIISHSGFLKFEQIPKYNLLRDQEEQYTKIVAKDPLAIGGRTDSIREKLGREHAWEADIRYTQCFTMDRNLTPGLMYRVQQSNLVPVPQDFSTEDANRIRGLFKDDKELSKLIEEYLPLFLTPAPSLPRLAIDIEVESEFIDRIPDPTQAPQPIISIAIVDNSGIGQIFLLSRGSQESASKNLPETVKVEVFEDERALVETVFRILWRTPILLTFNGDNFDLQYLVNRAKQLGIPSTDNPIRLRGGFRGNPEASLEYGVHIDLYRFLHNRSIQIYAFKNRYQEVRLETVSQALLGEGKLELPDEIQRIPQHLLAQYNWQDANLTMRLTKFDNDLVMSLILLLMRVSHQGMHDLTRTAVSNWIRSLLYYAHRQRNYLIPRQDEIATFKGEAVTEAIIKGKKYMGAIVVKPKAGVHFNVTVVDFASLYPSIMKAYNLSYETVRCDHPECKDNLVPDTPHWVCTRREGITSLIIGLIRDVRVEHFKPRANDEKLTPTQRSWFSVVEQALKVYLNACLPFDEEIITRTPTGQIEKRKIGSLKEDWSDLEVLSINSNAENGNFGAPLFVPIKGYAETGAAKIFRITLSDGRLLRCTANHVVPVYTTQSGRRYGKEFSIHEVPSDELKVGDELLLCTRMPIAQSVSDRIFIPDLIDSTNLLIGIERHVYKRFSYRRNQPTEIKLIQVINRKFDYSKGQKLYKAYWTELTNEEKEVIRKATPGLLKGKIANTTRSLGFWQDLYIPLSKQFFQLLGWYIAEGHSQKNRITITQLTKKNLENVSEIINLLEQLNWPIAHYRDKSIVVHSNLLSSVISTLCGTHATNKRIPLFLLNEVRAEALLETYFKGDGNFTLKGQRRYSTLSKQLANDLTYILGALGKYSSLHRTENILRIIETSGKNYARKYRGIMEFNGTNLVRVKSIEVEPNLQQVFDLETGNGWFVTTNGIVTHNSYGVLGAAHFPLYCAPAAECYSDDTEVLTENGWKLFKDLVPNEKVATLGESGGIEYELPRRYIAEHYSGPMFSQVSSNIDLLVTPNHNMYVGWQGKSNYKQVIRWGFRTPAEMPRYVKYKRNAGWAGEDKKWFTIPSVKKERLVSAEIMKRDEKGRIAEAKHYIEWVVEKEKKILMDDWLRFFGIWLAEGCITEDYKVIVTQTNLEKRKKIQKWLKKLPFDFKEYGKNLTCHNKQLYSYLKQFGKSYDKFIPREILNLSSRQLRILFESMILGDGWRGRGYGTASKILADNFQELILKMGCASTLSNSDDFHKIYLSFKMLEPMQNKGIDHRLWVEYDGMVYCVEVKNHLLYVRRNGKACWSGNSVTALGRYAITQTIDKADELGVTVLYGDTDSLFLDHPTEDQLKELIEYSEKKLRVELDIEKEYRYVALSSRKKNYLGVSKDGQVDIKGLTGKKRNTPIFLQEAFMEMIEILSRVRDPDGFASAKDRILQLAREKLTMLERREFDVENLAIRVQMTKNLEAYTKTTPQHVKAARQLQQAGKEVTAGDIIAFVKTTDGVKPVEQADVKDIDVSKYKDLVKSTFEQVLDALGIEWLDTIGMRRLDTFFG